MHSVAELYTLAVFYRLAFAAATGLFAGTALSLTGDISKIGSRVSMVSTLISVGPLLGPSVAGALFAGAGLGSHIIVGWDGRLDQSEGFDLGTAFNCQDVTSGMGWSYDRRPSD